MTDDQRADDLSVMPSVQRLIADHGTTFDNNFATYPLCCPSRTTFLTGEYAHNHGILTNEPPDGAYPGFMAHVAAKQTIGVRLNRAGYRTGYFGKFLNQYDPASGADVPPGWDVFDGLMGTNEYSMYSYGMNRNGHLVTYGAAPRDYKTDVLTRLATRFISQSAERRQPFFLTYAPSAPHNAPPSPGLRNPEPAPRDSQAFLHRPIPRPPSFDVPITGESGRLQLSKHGPESQRALAGAYRDRLASLLAVDRGVKRLAAAANAAGEMSNTVFIFTSDNGFLLDEHRAQGKERPYEESTKVPLVIRGPGFPVGVTRDQLVGNIDLSPTILSLAGLPWRANTDGVSLLAQANDPAAWAERPILYEGSAQEGLGYRAIRTPRYVFIRYAFGGQELFDLQDDPYELHNLVHDPAYAGTLNALRPLLVHLASCAGDQCRRPLPPIPDPSD